MMWWRDCSGSKVYVTYNGSDLDDAAGNPVTQFTKLVSVSDSTAMSPPADGITGHRLMRTGR